MTVHSPAARRAAHSISVSTGRATHWARMLPGFLIVGAQRCGTTSMYRTLSQHPAILKAVLHKGVHYFDTGYDHDLAWYQGHFPLLAWAALARRATGEAPLTFESSPYYMFHPLAAQRISRDLPGVRLLVLTRDPVRARLLRARARTGPGVRDRAVRAGAGAGGPAAGRPGGEDRQPARLPEPQPPAPRLPGPRSLRRPAGTARRGVRPGPGARGGQRNRSSLIPNGCTTACSSFSGCVTTVTPSSSGTTRARARRCPRRCEPRSATTSCRMTSGWLSGWVSRPAGVNRAGANFEVSAAMTSSRTANGRSSIRYRRKSRRGSLSRRYVHSSPACCIHPGARGSAPAANGIAAPQPMNQAPGKPGARAAMTRSCLGKPRPTNTMSGRVAAIRAGLGHVEAGRRRVGAGHLQAGKAAGQCGGGLFRHAGFPAQQVDGPAVPGGGRGQREDQRRAGHPFGQRVAAQPRRPDQRHPVGDYQRGAADQVARGRILPDPAADVDVRRDHPAAPALGQVRGDPRHHLLFGQGVEVEPGHGSHPRPPAGLKYGCRAMARKTASAAASPPSE